PRRVCVGTQADLGSARKWLCGKGCTVWRASCCRVRTMPTPYRLIVALVVSLLFLDCSGSTVPKPQGQPVVKPREVTEPTLLALPLSAYQLVFPPVEEARWRPRAAANWAGPAPSALAVTDPTSEFYVYGQRFSVSFNQPVAGAEA